VSDHVGLGGGAVAPASHGAVLASRPVVRADGLHVTLRARVRGTAHLFVWSGRERDGSVPTARRVVTLPRGTSRVVIPLDAAARSAIAGGARLLAAFVPATGGGTVALSARIG
jgi:hypothetical protein